MVQKAMQVSLIKRYGLFLLLGFFAYVIIRQIFPWPEVTIYIWYWLIWGGFGVLFMTEEGVMAWVRNNSRSYVVFPDFKESTKMKRSIQMLSPDPEGKIPTYEGIPFGGANTGNLFISMRDTNLVIAKSAAVEKFGVGDYVRLIHAPLIPAPSAEALIAFFGDILNVAKLSKALHLVKDSEGWFSLANILEGENTPEALQFQAKLAAEMSEIMEARAGAVGKDRRLQALRELREETKEKGKVRDWLWRRKKGWK